MGSVPSGFRSAKDDVTVLQRGGVVVEEVDTFSAPGAPSLTVWASNSRPRVERLRGAGECVHAVTAAGAADFATIGRPFVDPAGSTFAPLLHIDTNNIVQSTHLHERVTAHETDIISIASGLWLFSSVNYVGGPFNGFATAVYRFRYRRTAPIIQPPAAGSCR